MADDKNTPSILSIRSLEKSFGSLNVLKDIGKNKMFLLIMGIIFAAQFVFVSVGGDVLKVHALIPTTWLVCAVIAILVILVGTVAKVFNGKKQEA